jgi:hypothetical protein
VVVPPKRQIESHEPKNRVVTPHHRRNDAHQAFVERMAPFYVGVEVLNKGAFADRPAPLHSCYRQVDYSVISTLVATWME